MKAAYIEGHGNREVLKVGQLPDPKIVSSQVLVRIKYSALNHLDIWVRKGMPGIRLAYPHILGSDGAGLVEDVGGGVSHVAPGDEVIVHPGLSCLRCELCLTGRESLCPQYQILGKHVSGTHAEKVVVPGANVFLKPASIDFQHAAALPLVFTTAWQMVVGRARVRAGERVLVHAAGSGVSSAAIQIANLRGAEVIATAGSDKKVKLASSFGAHHTINYTHKDVVAEVKKCGGPVDVVIDHVGKDLWEANLRCLKWGGRIVICGATSGADIEVDLRQIFYKQIQLLGSTMGSKGDFGRILGLVSQGRLRAVLDRVFPLSEVAAAHAHMENRQQFGKILVEVE